MLIVEKVRGMSKCILTGGNVRKNVGRGWGRLVEVDDLIYDYNVNKINDLVQACLSF